MRNLLLALGLLGLDSDSVLENSLGFVGQIVERHVVAEVLEEPVVVDLPLVSVLRSLQWLKGFTNCWRGFEQVVVRDLGEEKVVGDVAVSDVVHDGVESEAPLSVDGLGLATYESPFFVFVHLELVMRNISLGFQTDLNVLILMLEIGDDNENESLEEQRNVVVLYIGVDRVVAKIKGNLDVNSLFSRLDKISYESTDGTSQSGNDTFDTILGGLEKSRPWPEVRSVWESNDSVDRVPSEPSGDRNHSKVLFNGCSIVVVVLCDPWMPLILLQM